MVVGGGGGVQSHFCVKPNFCLCYVKLWLSWGIDNIFLFVYPDQQAAENPQVCIFKIKLVENILYGGGRGSVFESLYCIYLIFVFHQIAQNEFI